MKPIPYGKQSIEDSDIEAVVKVLKSDFLTQGPEVALFEESVSSFIGSLNPNKPKPHALAVNNGTTALHLACLALDIKPGDRILVTGNSFAASANCVRYCNGEVTFVDINLDDYCIDLRNLKETLASYPAKTFKGLIMVDFAGSVPNLKAVREIANEHGLWIIEDACHALGGTRTDSDGKMVAAQALYSDIAVLSFHPVKHIATGEGGMILTQSKSLFEKLKFLRTHGITKDPSLFHKKTEESWYHEMQELGYNGRISDILCALGTSQMKRIDQNLERRRKIAKRYDEELAGLPSLYLPKVDPEVSHAYHLYVIRTERRDELYRYLKSKDIYAQVHYLPIYQHPYYRERYGAQSHANCDTYGKTCLSIPMYHTLSNEDQTRVIHEITEFFKQGTNS